MNILRTYITLALLLLITGSVRAIADNETNFIYTNNPSTEYIVTDYCPNANTKVIIIFDLIDNKDPENPDNDRGRAIFGSGAIDGKGVADFWLSTDRNASGYGGSTEMRMRTGNTTTTVTWNVTASKDAPSANRYRATLENGKLVMDLSTDYGKTWTPFNTAEWKKSPYFESTVPMTIGAVNCGNKRWDYHAPIRFYEMIIEENGHIVRHYYPALHGADSYGYVYDAVKGIKDTKYWFENKDIKPTYCQHRYVTANGNKNIKCLLCDKQDETWADWATKHKNAYGLASVQPYLDVNNLDANRNPQTNVIVTGIGGIKDYVVVDANTKDYITSGTGKTYEMSKEIHLPNCDKQRKLYICAQTRVGEKIKVNGNELTDSLTTYAVMEVTQKPLHMPHEVTVTQKPGTQKDGTQKPYNEIHWYIEQPFNDKDTLTANDLMASDQFMVYRAYKSDYSDEAPLMNGAIAVESYIVGKGDARGHYTIYDTTPEGQYNPEEKAKNASAVADTDILKQLKDTTSLSSVEKMAIREFYKGRTPIYYRVTRVLMDELWGEDAKQFSVRKTMNLHNMLPPISSIKVVKTDRWDTDKKVNLKVSLRNPYVWESNNLMDSAKIHSVIPKELAYRRYVWDDNASIKISRYCPQSEYDNGKDMAAETLTVKGSDVTWNNATGCYEATITDVQALPYTHYYYTAQVDTTASLYPPSGAIIPLTTTEDEANACYSKTVAAIGDLTASRGTHNGGVELNWQMGIPTSNFGTSKLQLIRREYLGLNSETGKVAYGNTTTIPLDRTLTTYTDMDAVPGHAYEYTLSSVFTFRGADYKSEETVIGWPSYRGTISGKVLMPNGTAVKGAKVYVRSKDAIDIPDIKDEYGKVLMQGVHTGIITAAKGSGNAKVETTDEKTEPIEKFEYTYQKVFTTDDFGQFCDTIDFQADGTKYEVHVVYGTSSFKWNGNATAELTVSQSKWEYKDVNMVSDKAYKFIGNVLYENSTMPVRNAMFELIHYDADRKVTQHEYLRDQNGDYILTDERGNFSIAMLPASVSLRVVKDGHTMKNGGLLEVNGDTIFTPQKDQNGLRMWDQTKVHLVGRIAGGTIQGNKPLGTGVSRNNLGDNLTVELELEGDNTSQIVYLQDDPDNTIIKQTFQHPAKDKDGKSLGYKTNVSYERKRIVITPDSITGEFYVDLAPTKYKVTKLSAKGYASFYQNGEGFDVLDYTDCRDTVRYNRIYHKPATVTYQQYNQGRLSDCIGETYMAVADAYGKTTLVTLARDTIVNAETRETAPCYTFGKPVFNSGTTYVLNVTAHEDYYYNNDEKSGRLDMVRLDGGQLHVRNGMMSDNTAKTYALNSEGSALINLTADNPNYVNVGDEALRTVSMQVQYKDYYYEGSPLQAFVLGEKDKGVDIVPIADEMKLLDVIRDPYGSKSYAWREKGTKYHWTIDKTSGYNTYFNATVTLGGGSDVYFGLGAAVKTSFAATGTGNISITNIQNKTTRTMSQYEMTTTERISTSADPLDVGAMADVYVGMVNEIGIGENTAVAVIDGARYEAVKDNVTLVAKGACDKEKFYIVIGDTYRAEISVGKSDFAYSQKHILGTLIPDLEQKRDALLLAEGTTAEKAKLIADGMKTPQYYKDADGKVQMVAPDDDKNHTNDYVRYNNAIDQWRGLIRKNEKAKVDATANSDNFIKQYSVATSSVDYTQAAETYNQTFSWITPMFVSGGFTAGTKKGGNGTKADPIYGPQNKDGDGSGVVGTSRPGTSGQNVWAGAIIEISAGGGRNKVASVSREYYKTESAGFGFHLDTNDNGYMTMGVYRDVSEETTHTIIDNTTAGQLQESRDEKIDYTNDKEYVDGKSDATKISNFIYRLEGGASRQPWYDADKTMVFNPGTALGNRTMKIDNPKIYIDAPVVSNLPEDETATFKIRLTNETEIADNTTYLNPSFFVLNQVDGTNPNGAKLFIDGAPIGDGRKFLIAPGESIVKTLEVQKGVNYNFNDIKLSFRDDANSLTDVAAISVNFLPMATKVNIVSPTDKWVMNTLSDHDEKGYFIPVTLGGFNTTSDGFHHIELQYKKQTEGDAQWVTFDSFYDNDDYFNAATGVKHKIDNGKITNVKFHGEQDPMEMKYDLRAVAFRQLGTGFATRASSVMSGTKDTRCPEIFGVPAPASGILTYEDVIQMNFTEPIAYNYLDKISNFQVQGYTNNSNIALSSSLQFNGKENQHALTTVNRNLNKRSFTIDMMVKTAEAKKNMVFFSQGNEDHNMSFGITDDNRLYSRISGAVSTSIPLDSCKIDITQSLTHVGMIYDNETGNVEFFAGGGIIDSDTVNKAGRGYSASGKVSLGRDIDSETDNLFKGNMLEVRLWGKKLTGTLISQYNGKRLSGYEHQLIAHWPMTETSGNVIKDNAHGANITLDGDIEWANIDGYSLITNKKPVELNAELITASADDDNTLSFWFKVDNELEEDNVALFSAGKKNLREKGAGKLFIGFNKHNLVVVSNGQTYDVAAREDMLDSKWHHFAMTINRSSDLFTTYIDGKPTIETEACKMDGITSDYVAFGDSALKAHFDVFTRWELALPKNMIQRYYNMRYSGKEMGLKAYMPFTKPKQSEQGVMYNDSCVFNCTYSMDSDGNWIQSKQRMVTSEFKADENLDRTEHAPIREMPALENLDFSWSSTGTALQININRADKDINKQNIMVTVRGIEDEYGNMLKSPQMITYFVDKNLLKWDLQSLDLECNEGQEAVTIAAWRNISGKQLNFTIDGLPSWLHADYTQGVVAPQEEKTLSLRTDAGVAAGSYESVIYLTDDNGLSAPLLVSFTVNPPKSGWDIDRTAFDRTMNLRAIVKTKNCNNNYVLDADPEDVVGAFIGNVCVGAANISDDGRLYMTIYGDTLFAKYNRDITFRLWKHDTGEIFELEHKKDNSSYDYITFRTNSAVGLPPQEPVTLVATDKKIQSLNLNRGWNWVSFNLQPSATEGINAIFINQKGLFSDGDIIKHVDFAQYSEKTLDWMGYLDKTDFHNVYQIYVNKEGLYRIVGYELPEDSLVVPVKAGWNDVPYLLTSATTIDNALADFMINDKAHTGDIIKSLDEFAVADGSEGQMKWVGTLKYMQPGVGYYLYHKGTPTSFKYQPNVLALNVPEQSNSKASYTLTQSSTSMPVIATIADGIDIQEGDTILALTGGQVVGAAAIVYDASASGITRTATDATTRAATYAATYAATVPDASVSASLRSYISVNANNGNAITFALYRDGQIIATTSTPVQYNSDAILGALDKPYVIDFNAKPQQTDGDIYDLSGKKMDNTNLPRGIYINGNRKIAK